MARKLLVCAATKPELQTFWRDGEDWPLDAENFVVESEDIAYALTGVGIPCTLARLLPLLTRLCPTLILNIGIAGAYPNSGLHIGDVAMAGSEIVGDIGFELPTEPGFKFIGESPFGHFYRKLPLTQASSFILDPSSLPVVGGCTVNECTGTEETGRRRERMFGVGMESMEGAAVAMAGDAAGGIPVCEIRAISNFASERDMRPENIALALRNLRQYLRACRDREGI